MASLIKPNGLSNFENELTDSAGLEVADNVVIDAPYIIEKRRGQKEVGTSMTSIDDRAKQLLVYKDRILRHYNDILQFQSDDNFTFQDFDGAYLETEANLRIKGKESVGNFFFTTEEGIKKISAATASDFATSVGYIRPAGGVRALTLEGIIDYTPAGFFSPNSKVAYFLVWAYKDQNENIIRGYPSSRLVLSNTSTGINVAEVSTITVSGALTSSQYVLLSSATLDYFIWFDNTGTDPVPQTAETVNRTAIRVNLTGLSTNDQRASAIANAVSLVSEFKAEVTSSVVTITLTDSSSGDVPDIAEQSGGTANVIVATLTQGSVTEALNANTTITSIIPDEILDSASPTEYFYELYRTAVSTADASVALIDIDPGSEAQKVFEGFLTDADVIAKKITILDITPESFRESGIFLYTNPITGEGILQANGKPPIAKDLELFRNYMFYANTKTSHRLTVDLLSVTEFVTAVSDFIIGDSTVTRTYTAIGTPESFDLTTDSRSNTTVGGYVNFNSGNNAVKYTMWFDTTGSDTPPLITNRQLVRVDISAGAGVADTAAGTAAATLVALNQLSDFVCNLVSTTITIECVDNGVTDDASIASPLGGTWLISNIVDGTGEDLNAGEFLLSSLPSAAQAIEETAKSLINVINADTLSPLSAFYISGEDDLPGKILLERKDTSDIPFFVMTSDANIADSFNPEIPVTETVTSILFSAGSNSPAKIVAAGHGLVTGDTIYIYNTATVPVIRGKYTVNVLDINNFTIPVNITTQDVSSNALFAYASNASDNIVAPNRLYYSKQDQPEAVPILNYIDIGPKDKQIRRILALRDNLFVLKDDGVYIVTGTSNPFNFRLLTGSTRILAPDSAVVLDNLVYALTTQGIVVISETGVSVISRDIESRILKVTSPGYIFSHSFGINYETDRAYILFLPTVKNNMVLNQAYRYNTITQNWTRWTLTGTCGLVRDFDNLLYISPSDRNYLTQERKNRERSDFADREIDLGIIAGSQSSKSLQLTSVAEVGVGDCLYQEMYVSIAVYERLLRKLDIDGGLDSDYVATLGNVPFGSSMPAKLAALNAKLIADDTSGTVTNHAPFSSNIATQRDQFNALIAELNDVNCDTNLKNYKDAEDLVSFEALVMAINKVGNQVTLNLEIPYVSGDCSIFKGINSRVVFAYQTFGEPEMFKQIREATILLDQNKFYQMVLGFKTDNSQSFESITVFGQGIGTWGYSGFGDYVYGGEGNDEGKRVLIPRTKQRCRYMQMSYEHIGAREEVRCLGISAQVRAVSSRAYR